MPESAALGGLAGVQTGRELLAEIHELFLQKWGMHAGQADARMGRFNYQAARAALEGGAA